VEEQLHLFLTSALNGSRPNRRWDNIKMYFREIGWEGVDWTHVAQEGDRWRDVVNTVMNLWVA